MNTEANLDKSKIYTNLSLGNLPNEIWKPIKYAPKEYSISNLGRIKSTKYKVDRIMKQNNCKGYLVIKLSGKANRKDFRVNRLVAEHFIDNPEYKPQVNHINEIKTDNTVGNLEWCTVLENVRHGTAISRQVKTKSTPVIQRTLDGKFVKKWINAREVERQIGFNHAGIYAAMNGKYKQSMGYKWEYERK